jgi:ribosomal protein S18 acetylase RimI-like enzyme
VTTHLEMTDPGALRPARTPAVAVRLEQAVIPSPELNRFLYTAVGGNWYWIDRLGWSYAEWMRYLDRPELETWVATVAGTPAGYYELERQEGGSVEIAYFGLLPQFIGQGLGGYLLTCAVRRAWEMGGGRSAATQHVWVHTCTLDGPAALANYQGRGFRVFKEESAEVDLPDASPGPWPGSGKV